MKYVYDDGTERWFVQGLLHREDGPAVVYTDGYKEWWIKGDRHREDGPAVEYITGEKIWYLRGEYYKTEEDWKQALIKQNRPKKIALVNDYIENYKR